MNVKKDIIIFKDDTLEIEVNISPSEDTVWLTQEQISTLFNKNKSTISRHIKNIFDSGELNKNESVVKNATELSITDYRTGEIQNAKREIEYYNLDVIISVGYRVNSIRGIAFRKWANNILKEYMYKGFVVDQERLISNDKNYKSFATTVKLISDLVDRKKLSADESIGLLKVISKYAYAMDTLDKYDHQTLTITNITNDDKHIKLEYEEAIKEIKKMQDYGKS
ncbi:RhuM family protein [Haploplasma axanthum]|uniref:Virulence protein n=1 Tax=Haploplasma axanthum TaxID=29552 RepID=A0A449BFH2_HAPAX|nr:RhuM family protein [Haploplasma axanthum]VEU81203.1 Virulence protein [Haploplasma axanthum]